MPIYLHMEGVEGNVTAEGYSDWMECLSLAWGVGRSIQTPTGSVANREATAPSLSEITVSKVMDKCTPKLFTEACVGEGKTVKIDLVQTGGTKLDPYMSYTLTNTLVASYSVSSGGDQPMETISLNYTKLESKFTPYDDKHAAQGPVLAGYDIAAGKKL